MGHFAIENLQNLRQSMVDKKDKAIQEWDQRIADIDKAIKILEGKYQEFIKPTGAIALYDDENPDYIKNTEDGI